MQQRGMSWYDLKALIGRNKAPDAIITYYQDDDINRNKVAIFDRNLPRRNGEDPETLKGWGEEDHWRNSHVTECANFNGMIPMESSKGVYNNEASKFDEEPYRGALDTLVNLRTEGCLVRSPELEQLFRAHGRTLK